MRETDIRQHAYEAVCGHYKIAATRWQKMRNAGRIGATEIQHLVGAHPTPQPGVLHDKRIRDHLSSFVSPLNEAQLGRRQRYEDKALPPFLAHHQVQPSRVGENPNTSHWELNGVPERKPGEVHMSPQDAATFRNDGRWGVGLTQASDGALGRAFARHELAEKTIIDAQSIGTHPYPVASFATHAGVDPLLAERMGQVDPGVHAFFDDVRKTPSGLPYMGEDERATRILKQHGTTPNYILPLGGRAHRSAVDAVSKMPLSKHLEERAESPGSFHANSDPVYDAYMGRHLSDLNSKVPPERMAQFAANNAQPVRHTQDQVREFIAMRSAGPLSDHAYGEARASLAAREARAAEAAQQAARQARYDAEMAKRRIEAQAMHDQEMLDPAYAAAHQARLDRMARARASRAALTTLAP